MGQGLIPAVSSLCVCGCACVCVRCWARTRKGSVYVCACMWEGQGEFYIEGGRKDPPGQKHASTSKQSFRGEGGRKWKKRNQGNPHLLAFLLVLSPNPGFQLTHPEALASLTHPHSRPRGIWRAFLYRLWRRRDLIHTTKCIYT